MELFNIETEQNVLSEMLQSLELTNIGLQSLNTEHFYEPKHQIIFKAIKWSVLETGSVNMSKLHEYLESKYKSDLGMYQKYIIDLMDLLSVGTLDGYIKVLNKYKNLRLLSGTSNEIQSLINRGVDPHEIQESILSQLIKEETKKKNIFTPIKNVLGDVYDELADKHENDNHCGYIQTGLKDLDSLITGFHNGDLVIIAARPSLGKTAIAIQMAKNMALANKSVAFVSLEMTMAQIGYRMLGSQMGISVQKMIEAKMEEKDWSNIGAAIDTVSNLKLYINDDFDSSINDLQLKLLQLKLTQEIDVLFIDYLQLLTGNKYKDNRVQEVSEISRFLKMMARKLNIPIIALSQLSRATETRADRRPQLSDLRDSGGIEQDADIVMMLHREDYYEKDSTRQGLMDIYVRKHRNGPVGDVAVKFNKNTGVIYNN